MLKYENVGHFTSIHNSKMSFLEPQFDVEGSFTDKTFQLHKTMMFAKVAMITFASAFFGLGMGMIMGSFEFNMTMGIDNNRSTWSQFRQHYFGYWRFLKRQSLHFSRFGLYIGLLELPMELIVGK
jgi:hypothetical protein